MKHMYYVRRKALAPLFQRYYILWETFINDMNKIR